MSPFHRMGADHLAALALTILVPLVFAVWTRCARGPAVRRACEVFFVLVLGTVEITRVVWLKRIGELPPWPQMVPMHLCDWAMVACLLACITRSRLACECAYFWGLAGTLQGLITPELHEAFPSVRFLLFFFGHGGIVGCVLYLVASGAFRPTWRSVLRAYAGLLLYGLAAGIYNGVAGTNFGYLRAKPGVPSLLDHLGPWPWYIAALLGVAAVNFVLLHLPWSLVDALRKRRNMRVARMVASGAA